jgi:putative nucleotidyltransferase with HDIG domain
MAASEPLSRSARAYVVSVTLAGSAVAVHSLLALTAAPVSPSWFVLAVLTLLSGSFTVRIPTIPARLSVSETFVFAAVLMFGPSAATVIVVLDTLVISFWLGRRSNPASRLLFNVSAPAVAIWVASHAFYLVTDIEPLSVSSQPILSLVFPLLGLAVLYFLLNSWLIAFAVAFQKHQSAVAIWRHNLLWLSLNYFSGASVAALLLPYLQLPYAFFRITGILLPILAISYLTLRTALGRVEDANRHLGELNQLYISTIETLAMAIDAKDQITHGHIRRVQQYAVGLARHLGVTERSQISAIEAASLLHDMGKLAVPEYILNKPGRLTETEFEKMKAHASVGADILSAIEFPYPVVPIVRHHHENWDGTGYPDGLSGTAIPIGARILSVVDCFDALTSDRPYRPRLSDAEAIRILLQRRGTMYDPLIVDLFIAVHNELTPAQTDAHAHVREGLSAITRGTGQIESSGTGPGLDNISSSTEETLALYDLAKNLSTQFALSDTAEIVAKHLRRIVPATTCVFFVYDPVSDELRAAHAIGDNATHFSGLSIPRGQRLSGWVGANLQTIVNSDPVLDLGEAARYMRPRLCSCLSTALVADDQLVGVLSLYSTHRDGFNEDHRRIVEVVARQVSHTVKGAIAFDRRGEGAVQKDQLLGLLSYQHLEAFINSQLPSSTSSRTVSIALIQVRSHPSSTSFLPPSPTSRPSVH